MTELSQQKDYIHLLMGIKNRIREGQFKAIQAVNSELILLYWDIGKMITERQKSEGWGAGVIPKLSRDIRNELPDIKGFSVRNIMLMTQFYREYSTSVITQRAVAQLELNERSNVIDLLSKISWAHNIILMQRIETIEIRLWYTHQIVIQGWSRDTLIAMIKSGAHQRQGSAITNFKDRLPAPHAQIATDLLKDPYIFDFLTLEEPFHERELETELVKHVEKFLIELGAGFAYVGRQYHIEVSDKDYYIDLLFYHLKLRCFIVIDLKKGDFKPEYAGKINFYCSAIDDLLKHDTDSPTIGLILCQNKDKILAEYSLRDIHKPIGVSDYELTRALPTELKSSLPSVEEIEAGVGFKHD